MASKIALKPTLEWAAIMIPTGAATGYILTSVVDQLFAMRLPDATYHLAVTAAIAVPLSNFYFRLVSYGSDLAPKVERPVVGPAIGLNPGSNNRTIMVNGVATNLFKTVGLLFDQEQPEPEQHVQHVQKLTWPVSVPQRRTGNIIHLRLSEELVEEFLRRAWRRQMKKEPHPFSSNFFIGSYFSVIGRHLEPEFYDGIIALLNAHRLITETRRQGTSGKLNVPSWVEAMQVLRHERPPPT